ncbi:MAG: AIR synthase [Firmicutes bacterium]|nr:AIR synthase [Bacillota bacterium]
MKVGKLSAAQLRRLVLPYRGRSRPDVLVGPGIGLDSAVVDFGQEVCVVSSDPITGAAKGAGRLAVLVATNDVAACGAAPVGVQAVLLLAEGAKDAELEELMADIHVEADRLGISVLGGHTEVTSRVRETVAVVTAIGRARKDRYVTPAGAVPGFDMVVTKAAGLEGTAILAADFREELARALGPDVVSRAVAFGQEISVVKDGLVAVEAGARAMHDATEGGLLGAVDEMCEASGAGCELWEDAVPVRPETAEICRHLGLDPLGLLSSGMMIIAAPDGAAMVNALGRAGIPAATVGRFVEPSAGRRIRGRDRRWRPLAPYPQDELWRFLEVRDGG